MFRPKCFLLVIAAIMAAPAAAAQGKNAIGGHVFNEARRPIDNLRVELLDEVDTVLKTTMTDGTGRYQFRGLSSGTFQVRVLTHGTNYISQTARVTITNISMAAGGGAQYEQVMFTLKAKKDANSAPAGVPPGATFVQNVPDAARQEFEKAVALLNAGDNAEAGIAGLKRAIAIFPDYFMALERLGMEYIKRQQYAPAVETLSKAIEVNPRANASFYGLGYAQFYLKRLPDAIEALRRSVSLNPNSSATQYLLGYALFREKKYEESEPCLKKAYELGGKQVPADGRMALAQIYSDSKRYKEAADELELYLAQTPDARDAENIRAIIKRLREKAK